MPTQAERIEQAHPRAQIERLRTQLAQPGRFVEAEPGTEPWVIRIRAEVLTERLEGLLAAAPADFLSAGVLSAIGQDLLSAANLVKGYRTNGNANQLAQVHTHLDNVAAQLPAIASLSNAPLLDGAGEAARRFGEDVSRFAASVQAKVSELEQTAARVQARASELDKTAEGHAQRVDKMLADFQTQHLASENDRSARFGASEDGRRERFDAAIEKFRAAAESAEAARTLSHEESEHEWESEFERAKSEWAAYVKVVDAAVTADRAAFSKRADDLMASIQQEREQARRDANGLVDALQRLKTDAEKLVGIVANTGMSTGYQKVANEAAAAASKWRLAAAAALGAVALMLGWSYLAHGGETKTLPEAAVGALVRLPFVAAAVGFAYYAARQAYRHYEEARDARITELQLASIGPYLAVLPDADQHAVTKDLASRFFRGEYVREPGGGADVPTVDGITSMLDKLRGEQKAAEGSGGKS